MGVAEYLDKPNNKKWISNDTFEALNCEEVFEGDILISRLPEPAGRACIIPKLASKMVTAVDCTIVRVSNDTSNKYLLQYLSSQKYFDEVNTCLAGGTRQRISRSGLANFDVAIPVKKSEQEAIGAYFSNLDHLITLHQSRRFEYIFVDVACHTLSWEQRKLGEVANIVGGGTPSTSNEKYWDGNIDWYAPAEIGEQIYAFWSIRKITEEGLKHSSAKLLPAFKTVLFTSRAGIGNMAVLQKDGATNQGFQSIVCNDCLVPYFVFSMGFQIKKKAERVAAGSTFSEISGKQLCDLEIMVTTDKEQLKIGSYFQSLDHLITLHQLEPFKLIFKAIAYRIIDYAKSKPPRYIKYTDLN